ncbi:hypothetical protein [Methylocella tundrae]|uniref:Uncharacterized protein n=1 Tax=Methylocella tundrae TaxID=227605 RepID=A0A4U8Z7L8_METTU|nr:hypothetical protein [Methylocella tundrae]WPP02794.1 hypothetical protein SIN04_00355 [Methylocella tundrae]VFU17593.1 protein of unknown function [Methylocella tundrae]
MQAAGLNLTPVTDALAEISEKLNTMDHAQDALLLNGHALHEQMQAVASLLNHLVEMVTPPPRDQEGPTLSDLLNRIVQQQIALFQLQKDTVQAVLRMEQRSLGIQVGG